jgi:uncharacterized protein YjbJ (UPF0337 family)
LRRLSGGTAGGRTEEDEMKIGRIDVTKLRGFGDKAVGLAKEFVGSVMNNERLEKSGRAQQEKASADLKALRKQVEAEQHESEAELHEHRQRVAQQTKSAS